MPRVYACPDEARSLAAEGKTTYLTPRGPGTIFPGAAGVKIQDITDGTSNTIIVVDATRRRRPSPGPGRTTGRSPPSPARGLFGHHPGGTNFGFADGSVRFLKETIAPEVLKGADHAQGRRGRQQLSVLTRRLGWHRWVTQKWAQAPPRSSSETCALPPSARAGCVP